MTLVYLVLLISLVSCVFAGCPTGTVYNSNSKVPQWFYYRCYQYSKGMMSFVDAESVCSELNGHLASMQNAYINMEVQSQANTFFSCSGHSDYWLGGNTIFRPSWTWTDGTSWSYTNWAPGQGSTSPSPQCLSATVSDGRWFSSSCDVTKAFVCAIPETTPTCPICQTPAPAVHPTCPPTTAKIPPVMPTCPPVTTHVLHNLDYWSAENKCISMGAHLASIHSFVENSFIQQMTTTGFLSTEWEFYVWIGLNLQNNQWVWTDGTPYDYQQWYYDPEAGYSCAKFVPEYPNASANGKWVANDVCSRIMRAFVCKKKAAY